MPSFGWFVLGWLAASVGIFVVSWVGDRRAKKRDDAIKATWFPEPEFPFGFPLIESDMVPDDKIYMIDMDHLLLDGKPADPMTFVMNRNVKARIQNLEES